MEGSTSATAVSPAVVAARMTGSRLPEPEQNLKCPRCESTNTKFCYYNNYNLSQPRHFCKDCRRYWTKGGSLRNIPVGGGTRKTSTAANSASGSLKRPSSSATASPSNAAKRVLKPEPISAAYLSPVAAGDHLFELSEPFSPPLPANETFGELLFNVSRPGGKAAARGIPDCGFLGWELTSPAQDQQQQQQQRRTSSVDFSGSEGAANAAPVTPENFLGLSGDSSCWGNVNNGGGGWPDLAIYAPGTNFQ